MYLLYSVIDVQQHSLRKVFTIVAPCNGEEEGGVGTREGEEEERRRGEREGKGRRGGEGRRGVEKGGEGGEGGGEE